MSVKVLSAENGGDYYKASSESTSLTKAPYDPLTEAKNYTDTKTKKLDDFKDESEYAFSISDGAGYVAIAVKTDGTVATDDLETNKLNLPQATTGEGDYAWAISDASGNTPLAVTPDGVTVAAVIEAKELKVNGKDITEIAGRVKRAGSYAYNVVHFEIYGQSLSQGAYSTPVLTTSQKHDSIMFSGGIRPQHPHDTKAAFYEDFIPLVEAEAGDGYVGYETPCGGATDAVKQLIQNENGINFANQKYQLLGTACGEGGMSINSLSTTYLNNNLKPAITNAFNLCQSKGLTYGMPLMGWVHGEQDNGISSNVTIQQYKDRLQNLIGLVDAHLKTLDSNLALNGVITTQLCSFKTSGRTEPHIELAIYQAAIAANTNVYLACPLYIFDYRDGYHVDGVSSKWMGAYIGLVHKRVLVDGEDWKPVHPISHVKQGAILEVKFHVPVQPLVFDTTHVALNTNYGFTLVDSANNPLSISSVAITQGDTVKIVAVDPIPAGAKLRYAWTPSAQPNRSTGPRGNLRDSQGNDLVFDPEGINKPLHNWCPIFEYVV
ncbi:hypothetical protein [Acinetobacter baumannii]|uniref:hypothetical protein n=1 Tax=Acinetobacter baumannii TaxID=470 RepID=UPI00129D12B9|nr:hypothetical protein [Acinetobacter baumannii]